MGGCWNDKGAQKGDVVHQALPGRKCSHRDKEEVKRDSVSCADRRGIHVLQRGPEGSGLAAVEPGGSKVADVTADVLCLSLTLENCADSPTRRVLPAWNRQHSHAGYV